MDWAKRTLRTVVKAVRAQRTNSHHNRHARAAYASIVAAEPDRALDETTRKRIRDYAADHFGSAVFAPWLETYAAWRGTFVEGCIPDNYHSLFVVPHSIASVGELPGVLGGRLFDSQHFPDLAFVFHGRLFDLSGEPLEVDAFSRSAFADHPYLYLKSSTSIQGRGVRRTTRDTLAEDIARMKGAILQRPLVMHPRLREVFPDAAATLRVTTVNCDGAVRPVAAYLRFGRSGDGHIKSSSGIRASIDLETGRYTGVAGSADWMPLLSHPDTGFVFNGEDVPMFADAIETCCEHHARMPAVLYLGWDVAVTEHEGIMFFEVNSGHADIKFSEACHGPIFEGLGWDRLHL